MGMAATLDMWRTSFEQILSHKEVVFVRQLVRKYKPDWPLTKVK